MANKSIIATEQNNEMSETDLDQVNGGIQAGVLKGGSTFTKIVWPPRPNH